MFFIIAGAVLGVGVWLMFAQRRGTDLYLASPQKHLTTKKHPGRSAPSAILLGCFFVAFDCYYEYLLFLIFLLFHSTTLVSLFDTVIYLIHMFDQAENLICVPPLIIIEADKLEEMSIDLDSFTCIKG